MLKKLFILFACFFTFLVYGSEKMNILEQSPTYLYKILSLDDWQRSQHMENIRLPIADQGFIHFATEDQVDKIINKYWCNIPQFVVLKIDTNKLMGNLILEANPGGTTRYYHLYDGAIPLNSVIDYKIINQ